MANVNLNPAPGYFTEGQTANWVVGDDVDFFAMNVGGIAPAISKYVAYDQLNPPRPFIAVTQDGNGNVVYDGGFPKIYNGSVPAGTTFAQMTAGYKYFINALNFIANPAKVAAGNKKVLVIGDKNSGDYTVTGTDSNSFRNAINKICQVGGFVPTFKVPSGWGGTINPTLAELDQYCCVFLVSSANGATSVLTDAGERELVTFRQLGNGILMITDSGTNISSIEQAYPLDGSIAYNATANKLARNFGAYFHGNFARSPVNVGFLRQTYGDHPLYAGITDAEAIPGGGSEAAVAVAQFTQFTKASPPPPVVVNTPGRHIVNITAALKDGTIESQRLVYVIATGQLVSWRVDGVEATEADIGLDWNFSPEVSLDLAGLGTIMGSIYHNNIKVGEIYSDDASGSRVTWYSGVPSRLRMRHWDTLRASIEVPLTASASLRVKRVTMDSTDRPKGGLSAEVLHLLKWAPAQANRRLRQLVSKVRDLTSSPDLRSSPSPAGQLEVIRKFGNNEFVADGGEALIYPTTAAAAAAMATLVPPTPRQIFDSWGKFSNATYYPPGVQPPAGSDAAAWVWDSATNSVTNPLNTSAFVGFISEESVSDYELDVEVTSPAADDDLIGIVLAATPKGSGEIDYLTLVVNPGGLQPSVPNFLTVGYNYNTPNGQYKVIAGVDHIPISPAAQDPVGFWNGRKMRLLVRRSGNQFTIQASDWNSRNLLPGSRLEFSLSNDPLLEKFIGPKPYGYCAYSQPGARYLGIRFVGGLMWDTVIDAQTGKVHKYVNNGWNGLNGVRVQDIFGKRVRLTGYGGTGTYLINADGSITKEA